MRPSTTTSKILRIPAAIFLFALPLLAASSCGDDRGGGGDDTGDSCKAPSDCYIGLDQAELKGEVTCIDKVEGGYCSHFCQADADCCAVTGECKGNHLQVCAPFESTGDMYCFLSCEDSDLGGEDADKYCGLYAHTGFSCRSTGGGSANRKVCLP